MLCVQCFYDGYTLSDYFQFICEKAVLLLDSKAGEHVVTQLTYSQSTKIILIRATFLSTLTPWVVETLYCSVSSKCPIHLIRMHVNVSAVFCVSPVLTVRVLGGCLASGMSPVGCQRLRVNVSPVFCVSPVFIVRVLGGSGVGDVPGWQSAFACECVPSLHRPCTGRLSGVGDVPGWLSAFACECVPSLLCVPSPHRPCTGRLSGVGDVQRT